jgi:hypothetical protein
MLTVGATESIFLVEAQGRRAAAALQDLALAVQRKDKHREDACP